MIWISVDKMWSWVSEHSSVLTFSYVSWGAVAGGEELRSSIGRLLCGDSASFGITAPRRRRSSGGSENPFLRPNMSFYLAKAPMRSTPTTLGGWPARLAWTRDCNGKLESRGSHASEHRAHKLRERAQPRWPGTPR